MDLCLRGVDLDRNLTKGILTASWVCGGGLVANDGALIRGRKGQENRVWVIHLATWARIIEDGGYEEA